ncbi:hypothetical protein CC78DRAFT_513262 [Lojkania enalia]|uniref:Mannosyltransferase n=1 Tax=Lojkania enalia TaxID=147567 RepID=A0A9P4KEY1_9PLEO|nr:hypothetical protein CC78DRAFT_513262 [Didymosphaeria enalia]
MPPRPASDSTRATISSSSGTAPFRSINGHRDSILSILTLLIAFRIANALALRTFFQPDEFFQSLEPAWQLAFGEASKPWITWEWRAQLRSSLHPALFAGVYQAAAKLATICGLTLTSQAELLVAAPKVIQAVSAALLDWYSFKLAEKVYGHGSGTAWTTLALSVCSPWQWFCSTRTLSNCLETTITSVAVYYWPWHWHDPRISAPPTGNRESREHPNKQIADKDTLGSLSQLRLSLLLAAFACILRPTNILIWLAVSLPTLGQIPSWRRHILIREILFCGSGVLACSAVSDRLYYQVWTLPPVRFLYFNIAQSLAVFYGKNRVDYYLTEGLPLLLTTALPFALLGTWQALRAKAVRPSTSPADDAVARGILGRLAWTSIIMTMSLSLISHKEVRFLYPVLPFLHVLSAQSLSSFLTPPLPVSRQAILTLGLLANLLIAGYASQIHQRGVIDVLSYLRHKHEARVTANLASGGSGNTTTTAAFLMPCHSTPWRSHLVHTNINAWALTCEPPLNVSAAERASYLDEADQFYINPGPAKWLKRNMRVLPVKGSRSARFWARQDIVGNLLQVREWPQNVVFFEQLEPTMREVFRDTEWKECWRGFNTHWHDDWRRVGDVVVWCLD